MHPMIARRVVHPLLQWKSGGRVREYLHQLEHSQWYTPAELEALQAARLRTLLDHAYRSVPYYRRAFTERGLHPSDVRGPQDLTALPVLSKAVIRDDPAALRAEGARGPFVERRTSGSTGIPLAVYVHPHTRDAWAAAAMRTRRWWGVDVGTRQITLINPHGKSRWTLLKQYWLMNHGEYSVFRLDEGALERLRRELRRSRYEVLLGYPSALTYFAQYVLSRHGEGAVRLKAVCATAEMLYPDQRALLQRAFGCPVVNEYGSSETGYLAGECPAGSLHSAVENAVIEFAPTGGGAGEAELLVTDLGNFAMPLIRYRVGDRGAIGADCACGRSLPVLQLVAGRTEDLVTLPDGRKTDGSIFSVAVERLVAQGVPVKQFRALQHRPDYIEVLVATDQPDHPALRQLSARIQKLLHPSVAVVVSPVDRIPVESTGKLRRFVSLLATEDAGQPEADDGPAAESQREPV